VTAKVAATTRGSKRKRSKEAEPSTDTAPESKKGKVATVAGPVVPKLESRITSSLFEIDEDSGPEIYDD
jgi:hypothetical protein